MDTKHTPGPWNISPLSKAGEDSTIHIDSGMVQIVDVLRRPDSTVTWANAHLIVAAPELLAALKDAVDVLVTEYGYEAQDSEWIGELEAVIDKAEGRA